MAQEPDDSFVATAKDEESQIATTKQEDLLPGTISSQGEIYSIFSKGEKRWIVFLAAYAGLFSPLSSFIYYPALYPLAQDLRATVEMVNLTITSYMIVSGVVPSLLGDMADTLGRRPLYLGAMAVYCAANIGLALQDSYWALLTLRMVQSAGSCGEYHFQVGVSFDTDMEMQEPSHSGTQW